MSQAFETLISYGIKRNKPNMRIRQCTKHFKVIHRAYRCIDIHIPIHIPVQYRKKDFSPPFAYGLDEKNIGSARQ